MDTLDPGLRALFDALKKRAWAGKDLSTKSDLAKALGVSKQTVSQWTKVPVYPQNRVLQIESMIGLRRWKMRPDIYEPPASSKKADE